MLERTIVVQRMRAFQRRLFSFFLTFCSTDTCKVVDGSASDTCSNKVYRVALEYGTRIANELAHTPLDRHLLNWFSERATPFGQICDVGCSPGHIARYLHERGVAVCGLDLSAEMVAYAQQLTPDVAFSQGNMRAINVANATWGGIVAFYSLIHIPRDEVVAVLHEFKRVLRPGGAFLLALHIGNDSVHLDAW